MSLRDTDLGSGLRHYIHKLVPAVQLSCLCKVYGDYHTCTLRSELFSPGLSLNVLVYNNRNRYLTSTALLSSCARGLQCLGTVLVSRSWLDLVLLPLYHLLQKSRVKAVIFCSPSDGSKLVFLYRNLTYLLNSKMADNYYNIDRLTLYLYYMIYRSKQPSRVLSSHNWDFAMESSTQNI